MFSSKNQEPETHGSLTNEDYNVIATKFAHIRHKAIPPPVYVANGSIKVNSKILEIGKKYPIVFENKKYIVENSEKPHLIDNYKYYC